MNTLKKMSDQELTDELRSLSKNLKKLESRKHDAPAAAQDFIQNAEIESESQNIKDLQQKVGVELLARDEIRKQQKIKKLEIRRVEGVDAANELLKQLPAFADKVAIAFNLVGDEYAELLALSDMVRKSNLTLLNSNLPQCINAALRIEPNNLHKLLKEQFRACFGNHTANVLLPMHTPDFDIVEAVKTIKEECKPSDC